MPEILEGKKILLGITGSIAAYKSVFLLRLLVKAGAQVQVIATSAGLSFVSALTLATLSRRAVFSEFVKNEQGEWANHIDLGLWADAMLVAPLTAKSLSAMANGYADTLLVATYLSARCPVLLAPAMDLDMYQHQTTQANLQKLTDYGNQILAPNEGPLASGLEGKGRMAEPEEIYQALQSLFKAQKTDASDSFSLSDCPSAHLLAGKRVLITAGPTQEFIDPVRYLTNRSTGKMGYALAEQMAKINCRVKLVSGPVSLKISHPNIDLIPVRSAVEMLSAVEAHYPTTDIAIFSAAVADYAPQKYNTQKIKKQNDTLTLTLKKNPDIAKIMGGKKKKHQINIGFALETENETENAKAKMHKKNFDIMVLNSLQDAGAGFGHDTNKVTIFRNAETTTYPLKPKTAVANDLVQQIAAALSEKQKKPRIKN